MTFIDREVLGINVEHRILPRTVRFSRYGGSMKPDNAKGLLAQLPTMRIGGLIGGACIASIGSDTLPGDRQRHGTVDF